MPLINTSVPNLIQGVSQQPDATRHAGQCEEQENALSSVVDGLKKRPNTRHVARLLTTAIAQNSFVHFIDRDDNEKYVVIHDGSKLRVFNLHTGNEGTINGSANKYYDPANGSYLDTSTPRNDLKALTVADNTFLLNTTKTVTEATNKTAGAEKKALAVVLQGDYEKKYEINVGRSPYAWVAHYKAYSSNFNYISLGNNGNTILLSGGYGLSDVYFKINGNRYPYTSATFDSEGRLTNFAFTNEPAELSQVAGDWGGWVSRPYGTDTIQLINEWTDGSPPFSQTTTFGVASHLSGSSSSSGKNADTATIAANLQRAAENSSSAPSAIRGSTGTNTRAGSGIRTEFDWTRVGSVISAEWTGSATQDFTISASDPLGGMGLEVVYKEVDSINSLPLTAPDNFVVKVIGDADINQDDYYVKFSTQDGSSFGKGTWQETVGVGVTLGLNADTMPMRLINTATDEFTLESINWGQRTAGDEDSNPAPSFVGRRVNNLVFFKNRLGFITDDSVVFSEANQYFNFYRVTVSSLLDSAPIDISLSSNKVTQLKSAVGFQENLILFSDNSQFALKGGDLLTPKTVSITPITNFNFEDQVDPLPLGSYIYFPFTRGAYTGLREFTLNSTTDTYDSVEITEHVPAYIPKNIIDMAGTTTEDTIALLSGDETDALYIYHYFWNNNQKVLSSWSKFTFDDDIRGIEFIDSALYMVTVDDHSNTHLLELPMEADAAEVAYNGNAAPFRTLVDKRVRAKITQGSSLIEFEQSNGTYSSANADLPYTYYNGSIPSGGATLSEVFVDSDGNEYALKYQDIGSGGQVLLSNGNATSTSYGYVGLPYTMKYKFSTQIFKASSGNSASPTAASSMQVRNGVLFFDDTHTFDVKVTPDGRSEVTETFSADDRPEAETLGNRKFAEGNFRFPVHSKAKNVEIVVENDSPFDSKFSSAEFESFVHPRSRRYG